MEFSGIRYYEFGDFRLDARRRVLLKNSEDIQLSSRLFDLLLVLLQNEGRILEHDELLDKVWEGMFVEQSNLKKSVSFLRHILGEHPHDSLYIKTVPRRGYSFVAPVRALPDDTEATFYRETEEEIIVEEEVVEDDEPVVEVSNLLPSAESIGSQNRLRRYKVLIAGLFFVTGAAALGMWRYFSPSPTRFSANSVSFHKLPSGSQYTGSTVSADGNYTLSTIKDKDGLVSLWLLQVATGSATRLTQPMDAWLWTSTFTPDGSYVYYSLEHKTDSTLDGIYKIPFLGGRPERVAAPGLIWTISPDGANMLVIRKLEDLSHELVISRLDGSDQRQVTRFENNTRVWSAIWSPDGGSILCALARRHQDKTTYRLSEISVWNGTENIIIPEQEKKLNHAVWLPDKTSLLLNIKEANAEIRQIWQYFPQSGEWLRVTNDNYSYVNITMPRDGRSFFTTQTGVIVTIWQKENESSEAVQINQGIGNFDRLEWTPDGQLVYSGIENQREAVWKMSLDGGKQKLTAGNDGEWLLPNISGDGRYIVFTSWRSGSNQLWRMDFDGKDPVQLTNGTESIFDGRLLSDGTVVYKVFIEPYGWVLAKKNTDDTITRLTDATVQTWDISPDEKHLVAVFHRPEKSGNNRIELLSMDGGAPFKVLEAESLSRLIKWTSDGKSIAYVKDKADVSEIVIQPIDGGKPRVVESIRSEKIAWFDWSPDGLRLVFTRVKSFGEAVQIRAE